MNQSNGITFTSLLGLLFIGLKLGNVIDWSWWWVLAPFWGPIAFLILIVFFGAFILAFIDAFKQSYRNERN